ncbi:MAG TPA: hypothetical protein VLZ81_07955, partial [Blastocatellia bacterium]|nr:hypothetical protein [Blastocatellia bacterium]
AMNCPCGIHDVEHHFAHGFSPVLESGTDDLAATSYAASRRLATRAARRDWRLSREDLVESISSMFDVDGRRRAT